MNLAMKRNQIDVADYLAGEEAATQRHEYVAGEVYAMGGASVRHNTIAGNVFTALHRHLRGGPCRVFMSDVKLRVRLGRDENYYYPDIMAACRAEDRASHYREHPSLLVEVLSSSTQRIDKYEKFFVYNQIESLQSYILLAQDFAEATVYRRDLDWAPLQLHEHETLEIPHREFSLPMMEVYAGLG